MPTRLSLPVEKMNKNYDAVVVGSGYGGGIAASRLSRAGLRVCLLERGREIRPGSYPDTKLRWLKEVQADLPHKHIGSPTALFDIRFNKDINVALGCGLGGTSLINAGIALRPDRAIFEDARWPREIREEGVPNRFFELAEEMLKPTFERGAGSGLPKTRAIERLARELGERAENAPLLVNFDELPGDRNHVGAHQRPCVQCGDCLAGCNHSAKNTVLMNYLPDAQGRGAEIFTEVTVRRVEGESGRWRVVFEAAGDDTGESGVEAPIVVLAAGTLGSTEILLRSAAAGLPLSDRIGHGFSGNGDMIGFSYNGEEPVRGVGLGDRQPEASKLVGPCSTSLIDRRGGRKPADGMVMADGTLFGALSILFPAMFAAGSRLLGEPPKRTLGGRFRARLREARSKLLGAYGGAMANTMTLLVVSYDDAAGRMFLEDDRLRIDWPDVGRQPQFERAHQAIRKAAETLRGAYLPNPIWNKLTDQSLITGHPLGGCAMGDDAAGGVVDHKGRVFRGASGSEVHEGLHVMDGAIVATPVGVNPLLGISALAERCCQHLAADRDLEIDYQLPN